MRKRITHLRRKMAHQMLCTKLAKPFRTTGFRLLIATAASIAVLGGAPAVAQYYSPGL
jgi:hypothetical protein